MTLTIAPQEKPPITLDYILNQPQKENDGTFYDVDVDTSFSRSLGRLMFSLQRNLTVGNDFTANRLPHLPLIKAIWEDVFCKFLPDTDGIDFLEIGPGPVAYSLRNSLLPLGRIRNLTLLEASLAYCKKIKDYVKEQGAKLVCGDIHQPLESVGHYDVIYCHSSLDSTPYLDIALKGVKKLLKPGGRAIIFQDVFPSNDVAPEMEFNFLRKELEGDDQKETLKLSEDFWASRFRYGKSCNSDGSYGGLLWLETVTDKIVPKGTVITTSDYWTKSFQKIASEEGFEILNEMLYMCGAATLPLSEVNDDYVKEVLTRYNTTLKYHLEIFRKNPTLPFDKYDAKFATNLFVLKVASST